MALMETGDLPARFASLAIEQLGPLETGLIMTHVADPNPLDQYTSECEGVVLLLKLLLGNIESVFDLFMLAQPKVIRYYLQDFIDFLYDFDWY